MGTTPRPPDQSPAAAGRAERPVVVVGAGIAGVACARTVSEAGLAVRLLDRGRRIGGRMASRRIDDRPVDLGASYFTVADDTFGAVVDRWRREGLAHPWTDTFAVLEQGAEPTTKTGPLRWGAPGGLRSLVEDLAGGLSVERAEVASVVLDDSDGPTVDGAPAAAVVLAMPDPQARRLLPPEAAGLLTRGFEPTLALVAWWQERGWDLDGAFVNGDPAVAWVADDGRRRGDGAPVLVAHSTPDLAARYLDDPASAVPVMAASLARALEIDAPPVGTHLHRWSLAKPTGSREAPFLLTEQGLGVCGDGWGSASKVEGAYLSGVRLGQALLERLA